MATEKKAKTDDEAVVEVPEEGAVTVELPEGIPEPEGGEKKPEPTFQEIKDAVKEPRQRTRKPAADDEAAAALNAAIKTAEEERDAERKKREEAEAQAATERRAAVEARRLAEQRGQEVKTYREQAEQGELARTNADIEAATKRITAARQEYRRATEAAEFDRQSEMMEEVADAKADLKIAMQRKADLESGAARRPPQTEAQPQSPPVSSQFEQYISNFTPRSQAWLRSHPDFAPAEIGGDPVKNSQMMAGHYAAKAKRIPPDTDEYFRIIEEHAGLRTPPASIEPVREEPTSIAAEVTPATPVRRPAPQPSAPPSREPPAPSGAPSRSRQVVLTKDQQEMARVSWPNKPDREAFALYAENLLALEAEGKLGRQTH